MTTIMLETDSAFFLYSELKRILKLLQGELSRQRERGRTPAVDPVEGLVIEEGEAEGLVLELSRELDRSAASPQPRTAETRTSQSATLWYPQVESGSWSPLRHAAAVFELSHTEYDALVLTLAVEIDSRFGRLVAFLNDHAGRTRPTLGMAAQIARQQGSEPVPLPSLFLTAIAFRDGLLEIEGDGPVPGMTLRVSLEMLARFTSSGKIEPTIPHVSFSPQRPNELAQLVLSNHLREQAMSWVQRSRDAADSRSLILTGVVGSGRGTLARAIASEAGWPTTVVELDRENLANRLRLARREARWQQSVVVLRVQEDASFTKLDWRFLWSELECVRLPCFLILTPAAVDLAASTAREEPVVWTVESPDLSQRIQLWQSLLPTGHTVEAEACETLAARFHFAPGQTTRAVRRAVSQAEFLKGDDPQLTALLLEQSSREIGNAAMGTLAEKIALPFARADLILPPHLEAEIDLALAWMQCQRQVLDNWGFARRIPYGRGLTALFAGPPGTGKTMAAQVVARELGVDLYRVDFSRLMSKWIGETEKNLSKLFDDAHAAGVALFFDEGDAVAGKRSEIKDAHDRYANIEIAYLLQRMEEHEGISIFATNRLADLDEAFTRRFHFVLDFPKPNAEQRLHIWQGMIPKEAQVDPNLDLARCAREYELTGGEIKNIVLAAAFLAARQGTPIALQHVTTAVQREFLKSGRLADM